MRPAVKRTILTSKATGRRYFVVRSMNRPSGRRYYVCAKPDCEARLIRETDVFCRAHVHLPSVECDNTAHASSKSDYADEDALNDHSDVIEEEEEDASLEEQQDANVTMDSYEDGQVDVDETNDSMMDDDQYDSKSNDYSTPASLMPLSSNNMKFDRHVEIQSTADSRSFRDPSGRRRYLCMQAPCANMIKRRTDLFCRRHATHVPLDTENKSSQQRHSAPPSSKQPKDRFCSPFSPLTVTSTVPDRPQNDHSDEYESPPKMSERTKTNRSFRDAAGKIRFLCANPSCHSRVARQADTYCRRHRIEAQINAMDNHLAPTSEKSNVESMDLHHNGTDLPCQQRATELCMKKRKIEPQLSLSSSMQLSAISANKIVIATTILLDDQWADALLFLRRFPRVQFSTNLNVNNSTTHLLIDDRENLLHCTITKKIVQAAVRRHVFIVSVRWIKECLRTNQLVDEHPYEIRSDTHTTLRLSVQDNHDTRQCLFDTLVPKLTYGFAIECRQCQGSISRGELIELIELSGGTLFEDGRPVDILVVLCDTNEKNVSKLKEKYLHEQTSTIKYVTSDFLLKSIIKFEVQDVDKYAL